MTTEKKRIGEAVDLSSKNYRSFKENFFGEAFHLTYNNIYATIISGINRPLNDNIANFVLGVIYNAN